MLPFDQCWRTLLRLKFSTYVRAFARSISIILAWGFDATASGPNISPPFFLHFSRVSKPADACQLPSSRRLRGIMYTFGLGYDVYSDTIIQQVGFYSHLSIALRVLRLHFRIFGVSVLMPTSDSFCFGSFLLLRLLRSSPP